MWQYLYMYCCCNVIMLVILIWHALSLQSVNNIEILPDLIISGRYIIWKIGIPVKGVSNRPIRTLAREFQLPGNSSCQTEAMSVIQKDQ